MSTGQPEIADEAVRLFRQHVFQYLPIHLLSIDRYENGKASFSLIKRDDLTAEYYVAKIMTHLPSQPASPWRRVELIKEIVATRPKYAVFSHHHLAGLEASFEMVERYLKSPGDKVPPWYQKLERFCAMAAECGCWLAWADTACIDKRSSAELEQAIRSMFNWYRYSEVCIIYLAGSLEINSFDEELWFTRGWTLQELLAPKRIKFYFSNWEPIRTIEACPNDKFDPEVSKAISRRTRIEEYDLHYFSPGILNVRDKMVWASERQTTIGEDIAYCLLGIFDISMPIAYGEGKQRAFRRLMEAIIQDCREWQIFAWAGRHSPYVVALPDSPACYASDYLDEVDASVLTPERPIHRPWDFGHPFYTLTKKGLEIKVLLVEMLLQAERVPDPVPFYEGLQLRPTLRGRTHFKGVTAICDTRFLLYSRWAVGIISYHTDDNDGEDKMGELDANKEYVCFLLGTGIYSPHGKWEKVGTRKVLTIGTKDSVVREKLTTLWL